MDFNMFALASSYSSYSSIANLIFMEHLNSKFFFFWMKGGCLCYSEVYFYFKMEFTLSLNQTILYLAML